MQRHLPPDLPFFSLAPSPQSPPSSPSLFLSQQTDEELLRQHTKTSARANQDCVRHASISRALSSVTGLFRVSLCQASQGSVKRHRSLSSVTGLFQVLRVSFECLYRSLSSVTDLFSNVSLSRASGLFQASQISSTQGLLTWHRSLLQSSFDMHT